MSRMTKADFLAYFATAVKRMRDGVEPVSQDTVALKGLDSITSWSLKSSTRFACGLVNDLGIFFEDSEFQTPLDNPVIRAVQVLGTYPSNEPMTIDHLAVIEAAWEYFNKKQIATPNSQNGSALRGFLNQPIEFLELSIRAYNALKRGGIVTLAEVVVRQDSFRRPDGIMSILNFGRKSRNELNEILGSKGLGFEMKIVDDGDVYRLIRPTGEVITNPSQLRS